MKRYAREKKHYAPPVTRVELDETPSRSRVILFAAAIGLTIFVVIRLLYSFLNEENGWKVVTLNTGDSSYILSQEFTFQYELGKSSEGPTAEYKRVKALYSQALSEAEEAFSLEGVNNSVNQALELSEPLKKALAWYSGERRTALFLAPVYDAYYNLYFASGDAEAALYDPYANGEAAEYIAKIAAFINDRQSIALFLSDGTPTSSFVDALQVSESYAAFAKENGFDDNYVSFGWMRNMFIVDYVADFMAEKGFTNGILASYNGFSRRLAEGTAQVILRNYPKTDLDAQDYYVYSDGTVRGPYIDPSDCLCKAAADDMVREGQGSCADLLAEMWPEYIR